MATDRDDEIARRYRALATEEPGAALDDAILAKSRRAVGARPGGVRRWGPPLSIAAVLMLASGVVIRMQAEKPGIEMAAPVREEAVAPPAAPIATPEPPARAASEPAPPPAADAMTTSPQKVAPAQQMPALEKKRARRDAEAPAAALRDEKRMPDEGFVPEPAARAAPRTQQLQATPAATTPPPAAFAPAPAPAVPVQSAPVVPAPQRAPMQMNAAPAAAHEPAADTARAAAGSVAKEASRLKAETQDKRSLQPSPETLIDRIAELRAAGRDDEADRALEDFRRAYPDFRFSDAQWEKVRKRAP